MTKKELKELADLPLTDFGNALRLQSIFKGRWVYLPQYKYWMYRDLHSWTGRRTQEVFNEASEALRKLARSIYNLPIPRDEAEQSRRVRVITWLCLSQRVSHIRKAVQWYRNMQLAERQVEEEVLQGS